MCGRAVFIFLSYSVSQHSVSFYRNNKFLRFFFHIFLLTRSVTVEKPTQCLLLDCGNVYNKDVCIWKFWRLYLHCETETAHQSSHSTHIPVREPYLHRNAEICSRNSFLTTNIYKDIDQHLQRGKVLKLFYFLLNFFPNILNFLTNFGRKDLRFKVQFILTKKLL